MKEVVRRLVENYLYIKPEKYKWKVWEIWFLEVVIGLEEIKIKEEKVKGVLDWPTPKEVKDIQKFLGLVNYYWWFIKDFAAITKPLHNIVKKDWKWEWIEKQEKVFQGLKERFTKKPVFTRLRQKNKNGSKYIKLCYRRGFIHRV